MHIQPKKLKRINKWNKTNWFMRCDPQKKNAELLNCFPSQKNNPHCCCGKRACTGSTLATGSGNAMIYEIWCHRVCWHVWKTTDIVIPVCCESPSISMSCVFRTQFALSNGRIPGSNLHVRQKAPSRGHGSSKSKLQNHFQCIDFVWFIFSAKQKAWCCDVWWAKTTEAGTCLLRIV